MTAGYATAVWENEGGATRRSATERASARQETRTRVEQSRFDRSHDSNARGEHRYPDAHQTEAERVSRRTRDDLKHRLGERTWRRPAGV
jgi:hypothetical protein